MKNAVYNGAMFLQLDAVCESIENKTEPDDDTEKEINLLVRCANLVLGEIVGCYLPLKKTEKVISDDGYVFYDELSKPIIDVYSVKNSSGEKIRFYEYFDRVKVGEVGEFEIEYSYSLNSLLLDDDLPFKSERISERIIAYGIACEYCIISGMVTEASIWQKRYYDALNGLNSKREKTIKPRGWV